MRLRRGAVAGLALAMAACGGPQTPQEQGVSAAPALPAPRAGVVEDRFAVLALSCVHREYPNKISHVMAGDDDAKPPRALTPVFYGCFDWHSAVHGHWLLVRLLKAEPDGPFAPVIREALAQSFTPEKIAGELAYFGGPDRAGFERPYGMAWLLQLVAELEESDDPQARAWREALRPLEGVIVASIRAWLPRLAYPIRIGTHNQSAFAFGLMLDYARTVGDTELEVAITQKALAFHAGDRDCPLAYEPSGEDFLSPCLMEADLMRRIQPPEEFAVWLDGFLPEIPTDGSADWLAPGVVLDPGDGKLVHLDGLNLSRAWALEGIASGLPEGDERRAALLAASAVHRASGLAAVSDAHYAGSHWLASFATYLTTGRGLSR